jgi:hypothetical protein
MWDWLKRNHEAATVAGSIVTNLLTLGALLVTFFLTTRQLHVARESVQTAQAGLRTAQASMQNSLIYTMQKDERTLAAEFFGGRSNDTAPIFAEMQSIYIQRNLHSIPDDIWPVFTKDFCGIMSSERLKRDWKNIDKAAFSDEFSAFMEASILASGAPGCAGKKP